ncbi:MAG: hypothetical protein JWP08_1492, partial [Bryobacterales bacterium]|nr:hypothetical protein [Bryobacterales bacterium]
TAGSLEGEAILIARLFLDGRQEASAALEIECTQPAIKPAPPPPEFFKFEHGSYIVEPGRKRRLTIQSPKEIGDKLGTDIRVTSEDDSAVIVLGNRVLLSLNRYGWYEAVIDVEGKQRGAKIALTARIHGSTLKAEAQVHVREIAGPNVRIVVEAFDGPYRALLNEEDGLVIVRVNARHPSLRRYFGAEPTFSGQESLAARLMKAEVVADEAVRSMQRKRAEKLGSEELDVERLYAQRVAMLSELLPQLHATQVPDVELRGQAAQAKSA